MKTGDRLTAAVASDRRRIVPLFAIVFLLASIAHAGQPIKGAFDIVLGATFDRFADGELGMGPEYMWAEFPVPAEMPILKHFRVLFSPIGYRIYAIQARDSLPDAATCRNWATGLFVTASTKYDGDDPPTRTTGRDDHSAFEIEQSTLGRRIAIRCSATGELTMLYEDRAVHDEARAEHKGWDRVTSNFEAGRYADAVPQLTELASQGHAHSEYLLGYAYSQGLGVVRDESKAEQLYRRAADKGMLNAQFSLGTFEMQRGRLAVAQQWLRKAAERNLRTAQVNLAALYLLPGTLHDETAAFGWFLKAAEAGDPNGQYNTCYLYSEGTGVSRNEIQAWRWCDIAATSGHEKAASKRDGIAQGMTVPQLQQARRESSQWLDSHRKP